MQRKSVHKSAGFFLMIAWVLCMGLAFSATAEQETAGDAWIASDAPVDSDVFNEADFSLEIDPTGWK